MIELIEYTIISWPLCIGHIFLWTLNVLVETLANFSRAPLMATLFQELVQLINAHQHPKRAASLSQSHNANFFASGMAAAPSVASRFSESRALVGRRTIREEPPISTAP